jgi:hypothetical protein
MLDLTSRLMKAAFGILPFLLGATFCHADQAGNQAWSRFQSQAASALESAQRKAGVSIAALPEGVEELRFQDFFQPVIGDRGLDYSERLKKLDGHRVRIAGFMVREQARGPGVFMLAPWPTRIESDGFCVYEDYPPATLHVLQSGVCVETLPFRPGLLVLTGVLSVKPRLMPDGRNCVLSLQLDADSSADLAQAK